jgi:hypothetical protein
LRVKEKDKLTDCVEILWRSVSRFKRRSMSITLSPQQCLRPEAPRDGLIRYAETAGGAALLQALVGLLLLFGGNQGLARVAPLADSGFGDELRAASAALLGHRLLEREDSWFLGQQMAIVKIAMIHSSTLALYLHSPASRAKFSENLE